MYSLFSLFAMVLVGAAVFVNGATDAPNAIAAAVATRAISFRRAAAMAAVCNVAGILLVGLLNSSVASTVAGFAAFGGSRGHALAAICAVMIAVAGFAAAAWRFGIPTSESHALVAALAGAAPALGGTAAAGSWAKVLMGLAVSLLLGFVSGAALSASFAQALKKMPAKRLDRWQIVAAGGSAFLHGAQDGQKFAALFVLTEWYAKGVLPQEQIVFRGHLPLLLLCGLLMALGTVTGGESIARKVGEQMVRLEKPHAVCSELAAAACLLAASLAGMPVSTTHTKTSAMAGAAFAAEKSRVDFGIFGSMLAAWAVTFPVCWAFGFCLTKLFAALIP